MSTDVPPQISETAAPRPARRSRWRRFARDLAFVFAILLGVNWVQTRHVPSGAAPDFSAPLAAGGAVNLAEWRAQHAGRPVGVYFWADWCPICKAQEGSIAALRADWPVLSVAMRSGDAADVAKVLNARGLAWPSAVDADGRIAASYGLRGVPALIVIGADGTIQSVAAGYTSEIGMRLRLWWAELN
jgi:thiol-disulfide isomerase/thioredoxin